jgi:hypothetical protein
VFAKKLACILMGEGDTVLGEQFPPNDLHQLVAKGRLIWRQLIFKRLKRSNAARSRPFRAHNALSILLVLWNRFLTLRLLCRGQFGP